MKKFLSMLLAVLMVVGMFPISAFAADAAIPEGLGILALSDAEAFEEGEVIEYTKWGMGGFSTPSWIATVPAGTETVEVTFDPSNVPTWSNNLSGGWLSYDEGTGTYDMGGSDLAYEETNGGYTITLDVKSMIENGNYYVKYNSYYAEEYALGFKYAEEVSGPKIILSTDAESIAIGDKFAVTATLSGNEGFAAVTLKLDWNDSAVEFTGFSVTEEDGEEFLDSEVFPASYAPVYNQDKGTIAVARSKDSTKNGIMFVANFEVIGSGEAEISLKKDFPDFVFAKASGENVAVNFDETDLEGLGLTIPATSITLNQTEITLEEGGASYLLTATVEPSGTTDEIVFTSSDEKVATVSKGGKVVSVKPGTATITAAAGSVFAECVVTVTEEENIIRKSPNNYSDYVDSEMTGVKSIQFDGETLEVRNIYKITLAGHEECYIQNRKSDFSNTHAGYTLDGTHVMGDKTWGSGFGSTYFNGSYGYKTKDYIVSYDDLKAAVGEENMGKLGVTEEDKLAVLVFKKVGASFNYVLLFDIDPVKLEGISIDETAEIDKGSIKELTVTFNPSGAEGTVTWKSSDENVATVDENGVVTAVNNGKATITATAGEFSDTCEVTVRTSIKSIPSNGDHRGNVTGIYVSGVEVDGYEWEDKTLTVYVDQNTNATATVKFDWFHSYNQSTSNTYEVEITNGEGYLDEFREYGDWVVKFVPTIPTTVLTVESEAAVVRGHEITLNVSRNEGATDEITWSSSDESVATVNQKGVVKGISEGNATITVKSGDLEATCEVSVILVHAESVTIVGEGIENGKLRITRGTQIHLSEVTDPAEHTDEITWASSDNDILFALEWAPGYFNANAVGTATVTVTVGNVSDSIEVEVYELPAEKITLDKTEATILTIENLALKATVEPENHTDGNIQWSSSDETVATVSATGVVTPVAVGEAIITAKIGNLEATCKVTVTEPEEGTVIWSYDGNITNGWPDYICSTYGVNALVMDGAKFDSVTEENGVQIVTLPHATAKDAEISLKVYACGMSPQQLGVNWHEGEVNPNWEGYENKPEHTFKLVDGEATLKIRAYKASGAGASRESTKTFKFAIGGEHVFDQQIATEEHLASEATCEAAATYYMSCLCGENGTATFSEGEALGHDMKETEAAKEPTCEEAGKTAVLTCANGCGKTEGGEEVPATGHTFNQKVTTEEHLVSKADCENAAVYYMSCLCGENGTETFTDGEALGHSWNVSYKWADDGSSCTATRTCRNDEAHTESATATEIKFEVAKSATCVTMGDTRYEAIFAEDWAETQYKAVTDIPVDEDAHEWGKWVTTKEPTYSEIGLKERECSLCDEKEEEVLPKKNKPSSGSGSSNKPNPGVTVIVPGDKDEEYNPNTGAPVFDITAAGIVVLAATAAVLEIKRRK